MKKFLSIVGLSALFTLSGCGLVDNAVNHVQLAVTSGDYNVTLYSGGKEVKSWILKNVLIQTEAGSDGYYWSDQDKITRVTGNIVIQEL